MIHGDLHYENVLAADREPWLAIDPKPMAGDPHYEVAPMLWNRWDEVVASGTCGTASAGGSTRSSTPRGSTRTGPATGSSSARCTTRSGDRGRGAERRALDADDRASLTTRVTIAKAVQD